MRPPLLRLLAGLLLLSWVAALAHVAQSGCGAAGRGWAAAAEHEEEGDDADGHCAHGAISDLAAGSFGSAAIGKVALLGHALPIIAQIVAPPPCPGDGGEPEGPMEELDPGGGQTGWFLGGRAAQPVRGPSRAA